MLSRAARVQENQGRVEFRERVLEERAQRAEACKRQAAVEEEKRLQALLRLAAMVPYADRIANIQADPLKPTKFTEVRGARHLTSLIEWPRYLDRRLTMSICCRVTRSCRMMGRRPSVPCMGTRTRSCSRTCASA